MELIQHLGVESLLCCELGSRSDGDRLLSVVLRLDTKSPQQNDPRCRPWSTQFNPFLYNISITYSRNSYNTSPTTILFRLKSASTKNHFNFLTKHARCRLQSALLFLISSAQTSKKHPQYYTYTFFLLAGWLLASICS